MKPVINGMSVGSNPPRPLLVVFSVIPFTLVMGDVENESEFTRAPAENKGGGTLHEVRKWPEADVIIARVLSAPRVRADMRRSPCNVGF